MNRLQKKCLITVAGIHLLLVVLLFCSGFITSKPKPDDSQVLDVIPSKLIDEAFNSGVKSAPAPAPTPPPTPVDTPPQPTPAPTPAPPKAEVTPPTMMQKVEKMFTPDPVKLPPDETQPVEKKETKPKPPKREIKIDLTPVVRKNTPASDTSEADAKAAAKEAKRLRDQRLKAFQNAARTIKENASDTTVVDTSPGTGSVSYANYASVVKSIYERAWTPPDDTASDDANVKVSVTISSDGRVLDAHIIDESGDTHVDGSVRRTLDRVTFIAPFPEGAKEKERTFKINFNLKAKRMLG